MSSPSSFSNALHLMTCIEIPIHLFGVYCILLKTPTSMKSVKWPMLNLHVWSVLLDFSISCLTSPFVLFPALAGFPLGVLKEFGMATSAQIYLIVWLFATVGVAILGMFENRYYLLLAEPQNSRWRHFRHPYLISNYVLAVLFFIPPYLRIPEQTAAVTGVLKLIPDLPISIQNGPIFVLSTDISYPFFSVAGITLFLILECSFFACPLSAHFKKRKTISQKTTDLQKKFLYAMTIQIYTPLIILIIPLSYIGVSVSSSYHNQALNNFCFVIIALHGLASTITMLMIHKCYRDFCFSVFCIPIFHFKVSIRTSPVTGSRRVSKVAVSAVSTHVLHS